MTNEMHYTVPIDVVAGQVGEETVILHLETGLYFGLDPVGTVIWKHLESGKTAAETSAAMLAEYDVAPEVLNADIARIVAELESKGLLIPAGA